MKAVRMDTSVTPTLLVICTISIFMVYSDTSNNSLFNTNALALAKVL